MPKAVKIEMDGASATVQVPEPPKKKCAFTSILPASVVALVQAAPNNETIRSLLLSHCKVPVPVEQDTWGKIKEWIEYNVEAPKAEGGQRFVSVRPPQPDNRVNILIRASETERGSCSYRANVSGEGEMRLTLEEIREAAENAENRDDFWNHIRQMLYDEGVRDHISMDIVEGSESYSDHNADDSEDYEVDILEAGRQMLIRALSEIDHEQYVRLFE